MDRVRFLRLLAGNPRTPEGALRALARYGELHGELVANPGLPGDILWAFFGVGLSTFDPQALALHPKASPELLGWLWEEGVAEVVANPKAPEGLYREGLAWGYPQAYAHPLWPLFIRERKISRINTSNPRSGPKPARNRAGPE